jgi:predicted enzyme related to lactoylglutathione lyase
MAFPIKEIAFIFHAVADVAAARRFYGDILGLKVTTNVEVAPGKWWVEYDIAGQALAISNAMGPGQPSSALTLEVTDLDATYAAAKAAGIKITHEISDFRPCRMFEVSDPDGNRISFHQFKGRT